eukprot:GHVU01093928.1.p1 GENE.GHVU01093928.1~~GHVU01093928.1.p1  ORF type:complete len:150 (-),score=18.12 GHVU01093928.1:173-622(-)
MESVKAVLEICAKRAISGSDADKLANFIKTPKSGMTAAKTQLVEQVKGIREFATWNASHGSKLKEAGVGEGTSPDEFLSKFGDLYRNNTHFRDGLLMGLVQAVMARVGGVVNAKVDEDVLAFCQVFYFMSPKGYSMLRKNLFGVSERHL